MEEKQIKPNKPLYKRWWFIAIVVLVAIGIIGNALNENDAQEANVSKSGNQQQNNEKTSKQDKVDNTQKESKKLITKAGGSITTKNFTVTLEEINKLSGSDYNKPADGKQFIELVLVIENISNKDYNISSLMMFDAYEDGFSINESLSAQIASEAKTLDGALAAGKKIKGKLAYELSENWKELEIDIDLTVLSLSTDGEIKIKLQNEQ